MNGIRKRNQGRKKTLTPYKNKTRHTISYQYFCLPIVFIILLLLSEKKYTETTDISSIVSKIVS